VAAAALAVMFVLNLDLFLAVENWMVVPDETSHPAHAIVLGIFRGIFVEFRVHLCVEAVAKETRPFSSLKKCELPINECKYQGTSERSLRVVALRSLRKGRDL
jgi:hypothetical protein